MITFDYKYKSFLSLISSTSTEEVVQKVIFDSFPFAFTHTPENYWLLRTSVCKKFEIHPQNFSIIGSAKLGFSLNPKKRGTPFSDGSDIDVVLISDNLFETLWLKLITYRNSVYCQLDSNSKKRFEDLQKILFWGQLRLDKLSDSFDFAKEWWTFFNELSIDVKYGKRQIRAAIFKSWHHATYYYEKSINKIKEHS